MQQDTQQADRAVELLRSTPDRPFSRRRLLRPPRSVYRARRYFAMHPVDGIAIPAGYRPFDREDPAQSRSTDVLVQQATRQIVARGLWKEALQGTSQPCLRR